MGILREKVRSVWEEAKRKGKMVKKDGKSQLQYDVKAAYSKAGEVVSKYYKKEEGPAVKARRLRAMERAGHVPEHPAV